MRTFKDMQKIQTTSSVDRLAGYCAYEPLALAWVDSKRQEKKLLEHFTTGDAFLYSVSFIYS